MKKTIIVTIWTFPFIDAFIVGGLSYWILRNVDLFGHVYTDRLIALVAGMIAFFVSAIVCDIFIDKFIGDKNE